MSTASFATRPVLQPASNAPKPLRLQVNTTGAWRTVIDFDRGNEVACANVITAAPLLANASGPRTTLRIVSTDGLQHAFCHWNTRDGWKGSFPS